MPAVVYVSRSVDPAFATSSRGWSSTCVRGRPLASAPPVQLQSGRLATASSFSVRKLTNVSWQVV